MNTTNETIIAPSILSADFGRLDTQIKDVVTAGADWIHVDVMDGVFVPNITIGPLVVRAAKAATAVPLDVHLMIVKPDDHLDAFAFAGADILTVHAEACVHLHRTLQRIRDLGCRTGVAFNPATPLHCLEPVLDLLDMVLIMSVNPGFGGQKFIPSAIPRIRAARRLIDESGLPVRLQVDGGITPVTAREVLAAGADTLVAGNAVYGTDDYRAAIDAIRSAKG
jgi:ribulose-phosphate 3-epimerase